MVKRSLDQKIRLRSFDGRHRRIETGAVIKNRKGLSETVVVSGTRPKIVRKKQNTLLPHLLVTSGKKKASVRRETSAVSGMRVTIVPKNQTTMPPHLPRHQ